VQTGSYGKLTMANWEMMNWRMAKSRISCQFSTLFLFSLINPINEGVVKPTLRDFCSNEMEVMGLVKGLLFIA